jgi:hypothetical protein
LVNYVFGQKTRSKKKSGGKGESEKINKKGGKGEKKRGGGRNYGTIMRGWFPPSS